MTHKEAKERLKSFGTFCDDYNEACDHNCEKCSDMEDRIFEALEKQIPKPIRSIYSGRYYRCPVCNEQVAKKQNYCEFCGQKLSEVNR